jgi:hypothetical protein
VTLKWNESEAIQSKKFEIRCSATQGERPTD